MSRTRHLLTRARSARHHLAILAALLVAAFAVPAAAPSLPAPVPKVLVVSVAHAQAPNPQTGEGYPEPRICPETQQWWAQDTDRENPQPEDRILTGKDEHTHLKVCIPAPGVAVSGTVRFDFVWQIHEMDDGYPKTFRIQSGSNTLVTRNTTAAQREFCIGETQCPPVPAQKPGDPGIETIFLNTDSMATGSHELRFHHESERTDDSGALATNGWHVCVRSCSPVVAGGGRAVSPPVVEARGGWFETAIGEPDDFRYVVSRLNNGWPANANGLVPLSGVWRPNLRTLTTTIGDTATPITRSFASVDPAWHDYSRAGFPNGFPGKVELDQAGEFSGEVAVDTREYSGTVSNPVRHTLWVQSTGRTPTGPTAGVLAIPFLVANPDSTPTPTPTPTPTATPSPTPTPTPTPTPEPGYDPECRPDCDQIITDLRTENAQQASEIVTLNEQRDAAIAARDNAIAARDAAAAERDEALADLAAMTTSRDAERERADTAENKLERIRAILNEPSRLERARAVAEE